MPPILCMINYPLNTIWCVCVHVLGWRRAQLYVVYNKAITITHVGNIAVCIIIIIVHDE